MKQKFYVIQNKITKQYYSTSQYFGKVYTWVEDFSYAFLFTTIEFAKKTGENYIGTYADTYLGSAEWEMKNSKGHKDITKDENWEILECKITLKKIKENDEN